MLLAPGPSRLLQPVDTSHYMHHTVLRKQHEQRGPWFNYEPREGGSKVVKGDLQTHSGAGVGFILMRSPFLRPNWLNTPTPE